MLFLLFKLGKDRYALDTAGIDEILPLIGIKALPGSPPGIAGAMNYRGSPVPVIDLSILILGRPAPPRLSTRIVVVRYQGEDGLPHQLGLIAEHATEIVRRDPAEFAPSGVSNRGAPYLGPVVADPDGLIQQVETSQLLPASVRDMLFQRLAETR
jgi:chemotaxis-related protein WspB